MKVFMSWSGARSKAAAELLHDWVKCVVQASRPWISTRGIGRGSVWFTEINNELKDTTVGIICLTHQNKNSPWILFEAGALAKGLTTNKVCTFLVDLQPSDIQDPLAQFNHTLPNKEGMMSLAATLNSALDSPLDTATLLSVFEAFWSKFSADFAALLAQYPQEAVVEARTESSLLEEILDTTRGLAQRMRVLEDRQSSDFLKPGFVRTLPSDTSDVWARGVHQVLSISEGIKIVEECFSSGMSYEETLEVLQRKTGKKRGKEVLEIAVSTRREDNKS